MGNIRAAMNCGAFDFITKPVDFDDLEATVERTHRYLTSWRRTREAEIERALQPPSSLARPPRTPAFASMPGSPPGRASSGDFADVVRLEHERVGLLAARAHAQGAPCASAMMNALSVFKGAAIGERDPYAMLSRANEMLWAGPFDGVSADAVYLVHDPLERVVHCAAAGAAQALLVVGAHPPVTLAADPGPRLGTAVDAAYAAASRPFLAGDTAVVCSRPASPAHALTPDLVSPQCSADALAGALGGVGDDFACLVLRGVG